MGLAATNISVQLEDHVCGTCGIPYAAPDYFWRERKKDGAGFYCPNGHNRHFSETEEAKLKKEVERLKGEVEWQRGRAAAKDKELIAQKGLTTKAKKKLERIEKGVCPECNRTFANVARHMQSKHGVECNKPPKGSKLRSELQEQTK